MFKKWGFSAPYFFSNISLCCFNHFHKPGSEKPYLVAINLFVAPFFNNDSISKECLSSFDEPEPFGRPSFIPFIFLVQGKGDVIHLVRKVASNRSIYFRGSHRVDDKIFFLFYRFPFWRQFGAIIICAIRECQHRYQHGKQQDGIFHKTSNEIMLLKK